MADQDRTDRVKLPMQAPDEERTKVEENSITPQVVLRSKRSSV